MSLKIFVTGTDTGVGKTTVSVGLLKAFARVKPEWVTVGLKPIASGANPVTSCNDDALALQQAATQTLPYSAVNPFLFQSPIAPHIAAQWEGFDLHQRRVARALNRVFRNYPADVYIIEGAGGWNIPLNDEELYSSLVTELELPVLLVVGVRLGCLNHGILTEWDIKSIYTPVIGWVANIIDPNMQACAENIESLKNWLIAPCVGVVPYGADPAEYLDIEAIIRLTEKIHAERIHRKKAEIG